MAATSTMKLGNLDPMIMLSQIHQEVYDKRIVILQHEMVYVFNNVADQNGHHCLGFNFDSHIPSIFNVGCGEIWN